MAQPLKRRPWLFPATLSVLIALSVWSIRNVPGSSLLVYKGASDTERLDAPRMKDYWTLHLHLDAQAPAPGPRWVVDDSAHAGVGHELCWLPDQLGLQLYRSADDFLLGAVRVTKMPESIDLVRRGSWFTVRIDGVPVMACLDPVAQGNDPLAPGAWFSQLSPGRMGDASITILDDGAPLIDSSSLQVDAQAVNCMRNLLQLDDTATDSVIEQRISDCAAAMEVLPVGSQLHRRLRHYLALAVVRAALAADDLQAPSRASEAIEQLMLLDATDPIPESLGMLLSLLPDLADHACSRPAVPEAAENLINRHQAWMAVLSSSAAAAADASGPIVGIDQFYQLRLLAHAADCLEHASVNAMLVADSVSDHSSPQPLPAEAPPWVAERWRAFAGGDPGAPTLLEPPLEAKRGPVSAALGTLLQDAVIEPASALTMSFHLRHLMSPDVMQALAAPDLPRNAGILLNANRDATAFFQQGPYREAALARAVLALRGLGSLEAACQALTSTYGESTPLAQRDPLAYALVSMLVHQDPTLTNLIPGQLLAWDRQHDPDDPLTILSSASALKQPQDLRELANYTPLLSGGLDATSQIWHLASMQLPPAQALASALAMESVMATSDPRYQTPPVAWNLLLRMSSYTVPLELLVRPVTTPNPGEHLGTTPGALP